jgi:hypothetical protein
VAGTATPPSSHASGASSPFRFSTTAASMGTSDARRPLRYSPLVDDRVARNRSEPWNSRIAMRAGLGAELELERGAGN